MSKHIFRYKHPILNEWLKSTTCHCYYVGRSDLFENDDHIVLKHNSHASYAGRFYDTGACKAYARLYRKSDLTPDEKGYSQNLYNGNGWLHQWDGRISKKKVLEECKEMGVIFDPNREIDNGAAD